MKIPENAFETYVALGPGRSYQVLADKFGVDKRSVVRHAAKENWAERLQEILQKARAETDRKLAQDLQAVRERQLMEARALRGIALKAMKDLAPEKALKAVATALSVAWKHELLLLGEPTDRQANTLEEITKRELETLLTREGEPDEWDHLEPAEVEGGDDLLQPFQVDPPPPVRAPAPRAPPAAPAPGPFSRPRVELSLEDIVDDPGSE